MSRADYDRGYYSELAKQVSRDLGRDRGRKQAILARSPHLGYALDAGTYEGMSSRELAQRELSELGIKPDDRSVEEQLLDAHHAGRKHARDGGGNRQSAHDSAAAPSGSAAGIVRKYIGE